MYRRSFTKVCTVLGLEEGKECIIVGTLYKHMKLKPSILDEYSKERSVSPLVQRHNFTHQDDNLVLEDESGRVKLNSCLLLPSTYVTGNIVALHGKETSAGEFLVEDVLEPGLPQQIERPIQLGIKYLTSCADVYCVQETKVNNDMEGIAKQLWSCRWMWCYYIEADGSSGGILIMWDCRIWVGNVVATSQYFESVQSSFSWFLTGVYAPHIRSEKLQWWEEIAADRGCGSPISIVRSMVDSKGCSKITNVMTGFSNWIEDTKLHDPCHVPKSFLDVTDTCGRTNLPYTLPVNKQ
ncbi:putative peptidyl-prolyl cis-trans isomerase CYP20-2, chloroplastic-like [Capsicum annuum]|nr:putative peptidyl-prolyl cis-trans isomerase CYP20-2, chloroplastic-like [Capsicum annuum]